MLFNKAAVEALTALPFSPGEDCVVVANDWHTAMFPVLLKVSSPRQEKEKFFAGRRESWEALKANGIPAGSPIQYDVTNCETIQLSRVLQQSSRRPTSAVLACIIEFSYLVACTTMMCTLWFDLRMNAIGFDTAGTSAATPYVMLNLLIIWALIC